MAERPDITDLLAKAGEGSGSAVEELFPIVYDQLRALAGDRLRRERDGHTLQATDLVHEAFARLVNMERLRWNDRAHFFALAGRAMRRILIDHARRRSAGKRGGDWRRIPLEHVLDLGAESADTLTMALGDALEKLEATYPEKAHVVELVFFGGLTQDECAEVLGVSRRTVARHWEYARAWLYRELTLDGVSSSEHPSA